MIDRIIWKVLLMVGGIVGSIISIVKLPEGFENLDKWERSLQHAKEIAFGVINTDEYREGIHEAESYLYLWGTILVVSIIILIIGCVIKPESNKSK